MKNLNWILIIVFLSLYGCQENDDGSRKFLEIQDAFIFENKQSYVIGDTIYTTLSFSRYLDEEGFDNKLDIFKSSGSDSFGYSIGLQKYSESSETFQFLPIDSSNFFAEIGTISDLGYVTAVLNPSKTEYESRIGIVLLESGRYKVDLLFPYLSSNGYQEDRVQIDILHRFTDSSQIGFEFEVTE